jgi:hypothetical protein
MSEGLAEPSAAPDRPRDGRLPGLQRLLPREPEGERVVHDTCRRTISYARPGPPFRIHGVSSSGRPVRQVNRGARRRRVPMADRKVWVFFYGSYINFGVLREVRLGSF